MTIRPILKWVAVAFAAALMLGGSALAIAASVDTTGTNVACATATLDAHTLADNAAPFYTISGASTSACTTQTYDIPTSTVTSTVTTTPSTSSSTTTSSTSSGGPLPVGNPAPGNWALAFQDEFNGTSIDTTKWDVFNNVHPNNGVTSAAADCSESSGYLHLDVPGNGTGCNISSAWQPYTGAATQQNAWELPVGGYVEFRANFALTPCALTTCPYSYAANWNAVWTSGAQWPGNGEIDLAEGLGKLAISTWGCTGVPVNGCSSRTSLGGIPGGYPPGTQFLNSFHTFGVYRSGSPCPTPQITPSTECDYVYWDGTLEATLSDDNQGGLQAIRFTSGTHGAGNATTYNGSAYDTLVDYVRGWVSH